MNTPTPIKIEVSGGYCETANLAITLDADGTVDKYVDAFKTILTFLTFHPDTIANAFGEAPDADEYQEALDERQRSL